MKKLNILFTLSLIPFLFQCIETSAESDDSAALALLLVDGGATSNENATESLDKITTSDTGNHKTTVVNASSTRAWVYVDLKSGGVQVAETGNWDLRFRRFLVASNSGASGTGQAGACNTGSTNFDAVDLSTACKSGTDFEVDSIQTQDGAGFADVNDPASPPLFNWYNYANTVLTAKNDVYLIRGSEGSSRFKLQMTDYYSSAGTSGYPTFRWARLGN